MTTLREAINLHKETWPGRGDWRARAMRIADWDGATPWERKVARDIVRVADLTPISASNTRAFRSD
jgi:hypothetical protein